jgi:hypothetical protein
MTTDARILLGVAAAASAAAFVADGFYPFTGWSGLQPAAVAHGVSALFAMLAVVRGARGAGFVVAASSAVGVGMAVASVHVDAQGPGLEWSSAFCAAISCGLALIFALTPRP